MLRRFALFAFASIVALSMTPAGSTAAPPSGAAKVRKGTDRFVTLITGDRVRLVDGQVKRTVFEPGDRGGCR